MISRFLESINRIKVPEGFEVRSIEFTIERPENAEIFWNALLYDIFKKETFKTIKILVRYPKETVIKYFKLKTKKVDDLEIVESPNFVVKNFLQLSENAKDIISWIENDQIIDVFLWEESDIKTLKRMLEEGKPLDLESIQFEETLKKIPETIEESNICYLTTDIMNGRISISYFNPSLNLTFSLIFSKDSEILKALEWEKRDDYFICKDISGFGTLISFKNPKEDCSLVFSVDMEIDDKILEYLKKVNDFITKKLNQ